MFLLDSRSEFVNAYYIVCYRFYLVIMYLTLFFVVRSEGFTINALQSTFILGNVEAVYQTRK